jgi:quercetin dioxygenase-like cupin family protein
MPSAPYPESITSLPLADIPIDGVTGRLLQGSDSQLVFFDIEPIGVIPPHSHGEQWGIVVEGEMELTIGGEMRTYRAGDSYRIPAGVVHSATFRTRVRVIDFFADRDRYGPKA